MKNCQLRCFRIDLHPTGQPIKIDVSSEFESKRSRSMEIGRSAIFVSGIFVERVMSHIERESRYRYAMAGTTGRCVRARVRACTRRESCVARANADLTYCACACARPNRFRTRFGSDRAWIARATNPLVVLFRHRSYPEEVRKAEHTVEMWRRCFVHPLYSR